MPPQSFSPWQRHASLAFLTAQLALVHCLHLRASSGPGRPISTPSQLAYPHTGIIVPFDPQAAAGTGSSGGYSASAGQLADASSSRQSLGGAAGGGKVPIGIRYKQGAVLTDPIGVYLLWVGKFTARQKELVHTFFNSLNPTPNPVNTVAQWWNITTLYYNKEGKRASRRVGIAGERTLRWPKQLVFNKARKRMELNGANAIIKLVKEAVDGPWAPDPRGVYAVITSSDIFQKGIPSNKKSSFCANYCGWHSSLRTQGQALKYFWVGLANKQCPYRCIPHQLLRTNVTAPDDDAAIHSAISMLAHELSEAVTNPGGNSWVRDDGRENADLCAWNFGQVKHADDRGGNPIAYNLVGQKKTKFFVQTNWDFVEGKCTLGLLRKH